jgi:hypothetical protein
MANQPPPPGISPQDWDATPESVQILVYTLLGTVAELQQVVGQFRSGFVWHRVHDGVLPRPDFQQMMQPIRREVHNLLQIGALLSHAQTAQTCRNILKVEPALWTFAEVEGVEPTNNAAERAWRRGVLWRKRSFGSQSDRGLRFTERMLTVVTTLRQQKRDVLAYLTAAGEAQHLGLPAPSLLPLTSDAEANGTNQTLTLELYFAPLSLVSRLT